MDPRAVAMRHAIDMEMILGALYSRVFAVDTSVILAHDIPPELAERMKDFAERQRAPELKVPPPYTPTARDRRLARRGRSLRELMGGS